MSCAVTASSARAIPMSACARVARARRLAGFGKSWLTPMTCIVKSSRLNRPASGPVTGKSWRTILSFGSGSRSAAIAADWAASTPASRLCSSGASDAARLSAESSVIGSA
jgi:hypothetical protein